MGDRVLSWEDGERHMTDLAHVTQLLQDIAHRERLGLPGLRDWLRKQRDERSGATERNRRLDSDATAVQVMTVYAAKGLQFPSYMCRSRSTATSKTATRCCFTTTRCAASTSAARTVLIIKPFSDWAAKRMPARTAG